MRWRVHCQSFYIIFEGCIRESQKPTGTSSKATLSPRPPRLTALASVQMETVAPILDMANDHPYLSAASVALGCAALMRLARGQRSDLPPGPKGYPIIGNLFDMPSTHAWEKFGEFGEKYGASHGSQLSHTFHFGKKCVHEFLHAGEITHLNVMGQVTIILNSSRAAVDLLDKRSATYSGRPVAMMCGEIIGWNRVLPLTQYGPRFREFRKNLSRFIGTRASTEKFAPLLERETAKFVARVLADPGSLARHIRK